MDPQSLYLKYKLLHPEHEDIIINSFPDDWIINRWIRDHKDKGLSLSAYILHERQEEHHTGETLFATIEGTGPVEWSNATLANIIISDIHPEYYESDEEYQDHVGKIPSYTRKELLTRIWEIDCRGCESADHSNTRPEMSLLNGFITRENHYWIDPRDNYIFYDISLEEFIEVQDSLLTELLNYKLIHECRGFNNTRAMLYREETDEENERWNLLTIPYEDDGMRGL